MLLRKQVDRSAEESLWAVSYADLLMVLLSFFIVFFSLDSKNPLSRVALNFKNENGKGAASATGSRTTASAPLAVNLTELSSRLKSSVIRSETTPSGALVLTLPDNTYALGKYNAPVEYLDSIFKALLPYDGAIKIQVIGHADHSQFPEKDSRVIRDNLSLSSFRAVLASQYLQKYLPRTVVSVSASQHSTRQSRSISIIIREMREEEEL